MGWASSQTHDLVDATAHSVAVGGKGAIPRPWLSPSPGAILALHHSAKNAEHGDRDRVTNPALVFPRAHVQWVMSSVFDAPIQTNQFQQTSRVGFIRREAGNDPDGFDFLFASFDLANAVNPRELYDVRKAHLFRGDFLDLDAPPFEAAVAGVERHQLRGKNPPAGGFWLGRARCPGCP